MQFIILLILFGVNGVFTCNKNSPIFADMIEIVDRVIKKATIENSKPATMYDWLNIDEVSSCLHRVSLHADTAALEGMACGGTMEVFIEPVSTFILDINGGKILESK